jgi:hypothetical protein
VKQGLAFRQEIPRSDTSVAPAGFGLLVIDHALPFQCSISDLVPPPLRYDPAAKQLVVEVHETADHSAIWPAGFGLATTDHAVPFQRSISDLFVLAYEVPIAKHVVALGHATPNRSLDEVGFGLG